MDFGWTYGGRSGKSNAERLLGYLTDFGGKVVSASLNTSPARLMFGKWDWEDYESMQSWANSRVMGAFAGKRQQELANEENERYWEDLGRYYGFDPDNLPYPIRSGRYGNLAGTGAGNYASAGYSATDSVMSLYRKWK